jgi:hypothetical protein
MTLMLGLHHFFYKCLKNVGQDSESGIVYLSLHFSFIFSENVFER